jgi:SAM-dependent methyltransferase
MTDIRERLAQLTPEQRKLLDRLAAAKAAQNTAPPLADEVRIDSDRFQFEGSMLRDQDQVRRFYDTVSHQLDASPFSEHARFLNYGYVANDNPQLAPHRPPPGQVNRNGIRLVLELIGDAAIAPAQDILDVGCGRGGTASVVRTHFEPRSVVGLDLAPAAIAYCNRTQGGADARFLVADAEHLPFRNASFHVVTNVESSHCYARIQDFFFDVYRVLRPNGCFLYTDLIAEEDIQRHEASLQDLGFTRERMQDITSNVLLSCDETAGAHARAFHQDNEQSLIDSFLGVPSSALYRAMKDGSQRYLLYRWRKRAPQHDGAMS